MNIDLLTKLVRLANNNPNDNEANLAARRACKLIEEGKFDFGVNTSKPTIKPPTVNQQYENPFDAFTRYYTQQRQQTASEYAQHKAREAREQQQQSQQNTGQYRCRNCGAHLDYITIVMGGDKYCNNCKQQKAREENKQYDYSKIKFDSPSWFTQDEPIPKSKSNPQENVTVKCLFCKQDFKRKTFTIDFICHQCYIKKNKSEKPPNFDERIKTYYKSVFCYSCGHGFTVTYTEYEKEMNGQVVGNCSECKASYIRAVI